MDFLTSLLFLLLISFLSYSTVAGSKADEESSIEDGGSGELKMSDWIPFEFNEDGEPRPTRTRSATSKHLRNIIEFHNNTVLAIDKVAAALRYEPFSVLNDEVFSHISRLEKIISKLEDYLQNMKNGVHESELEYQGFMNSIDSDIGELDGMSEQLAIKMKKLSIQPKIPKQREDVIQILQKIQDSMKEFDLSIDFLDINGIRLRDSLPDDPHPPKTFNISLLTKLMDMYQEIDLHQSIVTKYSDIENKDKLTKTEIAVNNEVLASARMELSKSELYVKLHVEDNSIALRQFVPILQTMRKNILTLIPQTEKVHEKMAEEALIKAYSAIEVSKKTANLIDKIKDARRQLTNRDEL